MQLYKLPLAPERDEKYSLIQAIVNPRQMSEIVSPLWLVEFEVLRLD